MIIVFVYFFQFFQVHCNEYYSQNSPERRNKQDVYREITKLYLSFIREIGSFDHGGGKVPWQASCKLEYQEYMEYRGSVQV
jgi:hypothetical protein